MNTANTCIHCHLYLLRSCIFFSRSEVWPTPDHQTWTDSNQDKNRLSSGPPGEDRETAKSRVRWEWENSLEGRNKIQSAGTGCKHQLYGRNIESARTRYPSRWQAERPKPICHNCYKGNLALFYFSQSHFSTFSVRLVDAVEYIVCTMLETMHVSDS